MQAPENPKAARVPADHQLTVEPRRVGALVSRGMVVVRPGATLRTAIAQLVEGDVGVVVVHDGNKSKGILSERDVIDAMHEGADLDEVLVDDIMQPNIISVHPATSVVDAARTMIERGVRHLMVEGPQEGVVSIRAVMESILNSVATAAPAAEPSEADDTTG